MVKVSLIIAIVLLFCAAGLGLQTKAKVEAKVRELAATQSDLKRSDAALTSTRGELGKANDSLATARQEIESRTTEIAKLDTDLKIARDDASKLTGVVKERDATLATAETNLADAKTKLAEAAVAYSGLEIRLQETVQKAAGLELALADARRAADQVDRTPARQNVASRKPSLRGLSGSVIAVDAGLNFVVLSVGDREGLTVKTPLLVMRGQQRVATLKITSVEPRTSVADVVPGTLSKGQTVQPGDRVVFAGGPLSPGGAATVQPAVAPSTPVVNPPTSQTLPARDLEVSLPRLGSAF